MTTLVGRQLGDEQREVGVEHDQVDDLTRERRRLTPYERISNDLTSDQKVLKEITLGKRIGFYRIRGEIGTGKLLASQARNTFTLERYVCTRSCVLVEKRFLQRQTFALFLAEKVAIKILDKTKLDQKTQRLLSREISSMERLHHPNVIRLYDVVETLAKLHIIMEYAGGGELFTKISNEGRLRETRRKHSSHKWCLLWNTW